MNIELNKLYFENCIEILEQLPDGSVDMFLQDPPFEVTSQAWDCGFIEKLPILWDLWLKKGKKNCVFVFKSTFPFAIDLINSNRKMFKYEWIWKKNRHTNFVNAKRMPMRCTEYLFVFYNEHPTYNPILRNNVQKKGTIVREDHSQTNVYKMKKKLYIRNRQDLGCPVNLLEIDSQKDFINSNISGFRHPNRTNPELWEYFIKTYTKENELVFDGYSGSGSIPEACIKLNRNFIACENSTLFFKDTEINIQRHKDKKLYGFDKTTVTQNKESLFLNL